MFSGVFVHEKIRVSKLVWVRLHAYLTEGLHATVLGQILLSKIAIKV